MATDNPYLTAKTTQLNPYLNTNALDTEQNLVDVLKQEVIAQKGRNIRYILRDMKNEDTIYREASMSDFTRSKVVEMYFESMTSFAGDADLFSSFGIESSDTAVFQVSCVRFLDEIGPLGIDRPREGDLLYVDLSNALFEIRNVIIEDDYYQLGKNYTWRLRCRLFQYSEETIQTGDPLVDDFNELDSIGVSDTDGDAMRRTLGLTNLDEETPQIESYIEPLIVFDPENPFGE